MAIKQIAEDVKQGKKSASDLVNGALKSIEDNKDYAPVISTLEERAKHRAKEVDRNPQGRLAGVPFIAKDNFLTLGGTTTAASNMLKNYQGPYQSTAIERLESEGAICVAKSNLDAWAHGSSTENSDFFVTKNPHDVSRVPGGSSGGSTASVALGIVPFALGTDTGGSVRLPASFCGVVGLKPTYGLVSRSGVIAMASSTDVIGPITSNVDDAALILDIMSGRDPLDSTTIDKDSQGYTQLPGNLSGKKFGIIKEYFDEGLEPEVESAIKQTIEKIQAEGAQIKEIELPSVKLALAVYYIICPAEVSSNMGRYDGQRYGHFDAGARTLEESYELSREQGFGDEAKRRIMIGTHVLSSGYYDAYYLKAQTVRTKIINEFSRAFNGVDFLLGPTVPTTAFKIGERTKDPLKMYLTDIMTVAANISGNPAISIPVGRTGSLPVGLQVIAQMRGDREMLSIAKAIEGLGQ